MENAPDKFIGLSVCMALSNEGQTEIRIEQLPLGTTQPNPPFIKYTRPGLWVNAKVKNSKFQKLLFCSKPGFR